MNEAIYVALGGMGLLFGALGLTARYLLGRLQTLETKDEQADNEIRVERDQLRQRVSDLEVRVESQNKQMDRLQTQLNTALAQLQDNQARLDKAEQVAEDKIGEVAQLRRTNEQLREEVVSQSGKISTLAIQVKAYRDALSLVGAQLQQKESGEPAPERASEPQAGERPEGT